MIVWRGAGALVLAIVFACSLVAQLLTNALAGDRAYWESHAWPFAAALFASAPAIWCAGAWLERRPTRELIDPQTGARVQLRRPHDLFFVPVKYWAAVVVVLAAAVLATNHAPGPSRSPAARHAASVPPAE